MTRRLAPLAPTLAALACFGGVPPKPESLEGLRAVLPAVAFELIRDSPEVVIVDLREPEEFRGVTGHLKGATNIPLADLSRRVEELRPLVKTAFLVYCRSGPCGPEGIEILAGAGYRYPLLIDGGIEGWLGAGFRTVDADGKPIGVPVRGPDEEPRRGRGRRSGGGGL